MGGHFYIGDSGNNDVSGKNKEDVSEENILVFVCVRNQVASLAEISGV